MTTRFLITIFLLQCLNIGSIQPVYAKPTFDEAQDIWSRYCGASLADAWIEYGSKMQAKYRNTRERNDLIRQICAEVSKKQTEIALTKPTLSLEEYACYYVAERGDLTNGFEKHGSNSMRFAFGFCKNINTLADRIPKN
jgi:hypothetical protein